MEEPRTKKISLREIFLVFLKIGAFALGGAYSMLSFYESELVEKRKWVSHEDIAEGIVIGQMSPGATIINTGIFIGYKLRKVKGALLTVAGQILPALIIVTFIAYLYVNYKEITLIRSMLKGIAAAVVGLISSVVYSMGRDFIKDHKSIFFVLVAFSCLAIFRINPIFLIVASGIAGIIVYRRENN